MLQKIYRRVKRLHQRIFSSMALYPTVITIFFFILALLMIPVEYSELGAAIKKRLDFLLVEGGENARTILSILVSGIISLTVFSFSMVMIVLNSASANLSPRILPGLITQKFHQIVLGFYLGSIVYSLIIIININKNQQSYETPSLSVLLSMSFGIISLGLFVYFIHSISQSIQVDNILNEIFHKTEKKLKELDENQQNYTENPDIPSTKNWFKIGNTTPGYFRSLQEKKLMEICKEEKIRLHIQVRKGFFTVEGYPYVLASKNLEEKPGIIDRIHDCFHFYIEEFVDDHYSYGFKQITEIATKALSPGINDPGTAIKAIDLLSILFIKRIRINELNFIRDSKSGITCADHSVGDLLYDCIAPIRTYGKTDVQVMINLLEAFKNMVYVIQDKNMINNHFIDQIKSTVADIQANVQNNFDRYQVNKMLKVMNKYLPEDKSCDLLEVNPGIAGA